jgi:hypothetical protein
MRRALPLALSFALSATVADAPRRSFALSATGAGAPRQSFALSATVTGAPRRSFALFATGAGAPRRIVFSSPDLTETLYGAGDSHPILASVVNCEAAEGLEPSEPPDPDVSQWSVAAREDAASEEIPT